MSFCSGGSFCIFHITVYIHMSNVVLVSQVRAFCRRELGGSRRKAVLDVIAPTEADWHNFCSRLCQVAGTGWLHQWQSTQSPESGRWKSMCGTHEACEHNVSSGYATSEVQKSAGKPEKGALQWQGSFFHLLF